MKKKRMKKNHWHKEFVSLIREKTGCNHEVAFDILGKVLEITQSISQESYSRGYDNGYYGGYNNGYCSGHKNGYNAGNKDGLTGH